MTDPEAAKIIDDLLVVFFFEKTQAKDRHNATSAALEYLMRTRMDYPEVTINIWRRMREAGIVT